MASIQKWRRDGGPSHRVNAPMNICMENVYKQFSCWRGRERDIVDRKWFPSFEMASPSFLASLLFPSCHVYMEATTLAVFQLLFAERYRQTVMCTMSHPIHFHSPLYISSMKLLSREFNLQRSLLFSCVSLSALATQTVRCWTPSRWLPHSPLFHFLPSIYIRGSMFAFVGIIPCYYYI